MTAPKKMPCEIRLYVSEEMHEHVKDCASDRGFNIAAYARDLIQADIDRKERSVKCRRTDFLIEKMAEKLGVEIPENEQDSEVKK